MRLQIVEEFKLLTEMETLGKKVLPVTGGLVLVHVAATKVGEAVAKVLPAKWVTAGAEAAIGAGVLAANAIVVPEEYKDSVRLVGYTCFGLAIMNVLSALGVIHSSPSSSGSKEKTGAQKPGQVIYA